VRFLKTTGAVWITAAVSLSLLVGGSWLWFQSLASDPLPSFQTVKAEFKPSDVWLLDRSGNPIEQMRIDQNGRRLSWTNLESVSFAMRSEVLKNEDREFYSHGGVDLKALASSAYQSLRKKLFHQGLLRGGSTISMQVAALLASDSRRSVASDQAQASRKRRGITEKLRQMSLALKLESTWSKQQILEAYLNLVHFRGEIQGLSAASHLLFAKDPHGLTTLESSLLAAMISSPSASVKAAAEKLCRRTPDACPSFKALAENVERRDGRDRVAVHLAPHAARRLSKLAGASSSSFIHSNLDRSLQTRAILLASEQLKLLKERNVSDASILVVDNQSGNVLVYVGSIPEHSSAQAIDGIQTRRQAGSTLKPFLYGTAFEKGILTPVSLLNDQPFETDTGRGLYRPRNYDKKFRGVVTVRDALASSMNVPAVKTLELLGPDTFVEALQSVGFENLNSGEDYGVSLALGTADVSLWELVRAYRTFANGGLFSDLKLERTPRSITGEARAFSAATAYRIASILSDREARSSTFGLENPLATKFWTAVKTGTSKDMRDNWCVGFSSRYTVGVWVGNFSGDAMWDVSGISGAAPIWVGMMNALHEREKSEAPIKPRDLIEEDTYESPDLNQTSRLSFRKILLPVSGSVMTFDPDIPLKKQKILLQASGPADPTVKWVLNGKPLGRGDRPKLWSLKPGSYSLKLISRNGVEDQATFTVRASR
jgi:penicillin-binding protein 1C